MEQRFQIHQHESAERAATLIHRICADTDIDPTGLVVHHPSSDGGWQTWQVAGQPTLTAVQVIAGVPYAAGDSVVVQVTDGGIPFAVPGGAILEGIWGDSATNIVVVGQWRERRRSGGSAGLHRPSV